MNSDAINSKLGVVKNKVPACGAIAVFVKTPGISSVKTRLASTIGTSKAIEFYLQFKKITEELLIDVSQSLECMPYWAVAEDGALNANLWSNFDRILQPTGSLGDRLHGVYSDLIKRHSWVLLIGADCPQLSLNEIYRSVDLLKTQSWVLGPAKDGGFYLFGGNHPIPESVWVDVPYSSPQTLEKITKNLASVGTGSFLQTLTDIDRSEDLGDLIHYLSVIEEPTETQITLLQMARGLMTKKSKILFLCTGNSCRSQMAEGWCRSLHGDKIEVYSAGIEAHGLNQNAVAVMSEVGVDISNHQSRTINDFSDVKFDKVYTVCGHAHETCPIFHDETEVVHAPFDDPPKMAFSCENDEEKLNCYRSVRNQIRAYVSTII
ncbi:MAG: hypothetical protein CMP10_06105 [Zetaproteobacteria bacterium]|nr:hypothetical protein [Pseudobdellovibrionaceae bacterium]